MTRPTRPIAERPSELSPLARFGFPVLIVALTFVAFGPVLGAGLVNWDDPETLAQNYAFRGLSREHLAWMFSTTWMGPYQPLAWVSFGVDHALWGLDTAGGAREAPHYHQTSVLVHALAALALYSLALRLYRITRPSAREEQPNASRFAAFFAALVFAVHPLRVESVAWVTERRDVLSGLFFVLAAWAWVRFAPRAREVRVSLLWRIVASSAAGIAVLLFFQAVGPSGNGEPSGSGDPSAIGGSAVSGHLAWQGLGATGLALCPVAILISIGATLAAARFDGARASSRWYVLSFLMFLAALLSKGLAMVLPALLVVLDIWPLGRSRAEIAFGRGGARHSTAAALCDLVLEKAPFLALGAIFAALAMWGQASIPGAIVSWSDHTFTERIAQCFYGLAFYPTKTLLPFDLSPLYNLPDSLRIAQIRFALPALAVIVACVLLVRFRARIPALAAACVAFAIAIAPVLGLTQAGPQMVADRYSYIACLPFALVAGGGLLRLVSATLRTGAIAWAIAPALTVLLALIAATRAQSALWADEVELWSHALKIEPENALAYLNLAQARIEQAARVSDVREKRVRLAEARRLLDQGLTHKPLAPLYSALARVHQSSWELDPGSSEHHEMAGLAAMRQAVEIAKRMNQYTPEYQLNLGSALFNAGRVDEAIAELASFVHERPESFQGRFNLGFALVRKRRFEEGVHELEYATHLEPSHVNAWGNLGLGYEGLGDKPRAIGAYRRVLALAPSHATAAARLRELTKSER